MIDKFRSIFSSPEPVDSAIIDKVIADKLTYLERPALVELAETIRLIEHRKVPGIMVENGCALGGSSIVITKHKNNTRPFYIYDVFGLIPSPGEKDTKDVHERYKEIVDGKSQGIGGDVYYGYQEDLISKVKGNFTGCGIEPEKANVHFVQGLYENSLNINQPVAFAHIDCDWYESVWVCLERIVPHLSPNGILLIDDYYFWQGCKKAVDDFFANRKDDFEFTKRARLHIRKRK